MASAVERGGPSVGAHWAYCRPRSRVGSWEETIFKGEVVTHVRQLVRRGVELFRAVCADFDEGGRGVEERPFLETLEDALYQVATLGAANVGRDILLF